MTINTHLLKTLLKNSIKTKVPLNAIVGELCSRYLLLSLKSILIVVRTICVISITLTFKLVYSGLKGITAYLKRKIP